MSEHDETRRALESSLRSLLPRRTSISRSLTSSKPGVAAVGVGGFFTGYAWGRLRGRRARKAH